MKNLLKKLPFVAFVLAILGALAFKSQDPDPNKILYGFNSNDQWVEVTGSYICDPNPSRTCVAQFVNDDTSQPMTYEEKGNYH